MTSESVTSPSNPPPLEQHSEDHSLPQNSVNSVPISAVTPSPPQATQVKLVSSSNGVASDQVFDEIEEPSYLKYLDSKEYCDRYRKMESEFKEWLLAKYFSVNVYEQTATIDGETIMSSRGPCTRFYTDLEISFADAVECLDGEEEEEEEVSVNSPPPEITPREIPSGDIVSENNSC